MSDVLRAEANDDLVNTLRRVGFANPSKTLAAWLRSPEGIKALAADETIREGIQKYAGAFVASNGIVFFSEEEEDE